MKNKAVPFLVVLSFSFPVLVYSTLFYSCVTSRSTYETSAAGAGLGGPAGALIDAEKRWRGGVLGGAKAYAVTGTVTEISTRAAVEAAQEGRPVIYQSDDGFQRVEETPVSYNAEAKCHKVRERIWQEGKLVKDEVKEVCESKRQ
jgi:hypothetical protein